MAAKFYLLTRFAVTLSFTSRGPEWSWEKAANTEEEGEENEEDEEDEEGVK